MKEVLSFFTFGIGALCFVAFFTALKLLAVTAANGWPTRPIAARKLRPRSPANRTSLLQYRRLTSGSDSDYRARGVVRC
jgi:hypothetical protein